MTLLALPLMPDNQALTYDKGQGFPSHIIIHLTEELIDIIKDQQAFVIKNGFNHKSISLGADFVAVDDKDELIENHQAGAVFTVTEAKDLDKPYTVVAFDGDIENMDMMAQVSVKSPFLFVGANGFWVRVTTSDDLMMERYISVAKNIENIEHLLHMQPRKNIN